MPDHQNVIPASIIMRVPRAVFVRVVLPVLLLCLPEVAPMAAPVPPANKRLHHDLMSGYQKLIKPSGGPSQQLTVKMGMRLSQVIDVVSVGKLCCVVSSCVVLCRIWGGGRERS